MNKKFFILVLIGMLILSMVGCASSQGFKYTGNNFKIGNSTYLCYYDADRVYLANSITNPTTISIIFNIKKQPMTIPEFNRSYKPKDRFVATGETYTRWGITYDVCYDSVTKMVYISNPEKGIRELSDDNDIPMNIDEFHNLNT